MTPSHTNKRLTHKTLAIKSLKAIATVTALAAGIVFIPNLSVFDEAVLPEIAQRLGQPANADIEGNAYYYLYGLPAASDKDPEQVGRALVKALKAKHQQGEMANLTDAETASLYGGKTDEDKEWEAIIATASCTARTRSDCFELLLTTLKDKPLTQARLQVQLQRYQQVIRFPHLVEDMTNMDYTSPVPSFFHVMKMGELSQTKAYLDSGLDGIIASSKLDMQFWRMAMTDSQTLIGKMVSIASLRRNLGGLSYAIRNAPSLTAEQAQQLQLLFSPLNRGEISMEKQLVSELRFGVENWQTAPKKIPEGQVLITMLGQSMATANWHYRQSLKPAFALGQLSPTEFYERAQTPAPALEFSRFNPYNLGGKLSLATNPQYNNYLGRAHDLAGIYLLMALQLDLKSIPPVDWPTAIKNSNYKNPYTQKPFDYDANTKMLSFRCFDVKDQCSIKL